MLRLVLVLYLILDVMAFQAAHGRLLGGQCKHHGRHGAALQWRLDLLPSPRVLGPLPNLVFSAGAMPDGGCTRPRFAPEPKSWNLLCHLPVTVPSLCKCPPVARWFPHFPAGGPAGEQELPGTGGGKKAPAVRTRCVTLSPTGRSWAAATTEGVLLYR